MVKLVALESIFLLWLFFNISFQSRSDLLRGLEVPKYAFEGGSATLSCTYDLQNTALYSLKWYHNSTEFYRFVPTERDKPINIGPTHKFYLREVSRTESRNILSLSKLTINATGMYRCEVIAEHPSFRTEILESSMIVLKGQLYPPVILGAKSTYEPEDIIEITCQPQRKTSSGPMPTIKWFLNNQEAPTNKLLTYSYSRSNEELILRLTAKEVLDAGGTMIAECRLVLGSHQKKASKVLRVRTSYHSYLSNFYSTGSIKSSVSFGSLVLCAVVSLLVS